MKLRFRANNLRLRVNQKEVELLAAGGALKEQIDFPGGTSLSYVLKAESSSEAQAYYAHGNLHVAIPKAMAQPWATGQAVGLYFTLTTGAQPLNIAIEKDMVCLDGPEEELDPNAFPRQLLEKTC